MTTQPPDDNTLARVTQISVSAAVYACMASSFLSAAKAPQSVQAPVNNAAATLVFLAAGSASQAIMSSIYKSHSRIKESKRSFDDDE